LISTNGRRARTLAVDGASEEPFRTGPPSTRTEVLGLAATRRARSRISRSAGCVPTKSSSEARERCAVPSLGVRGPTTFRASERSTTTASPPAGRTVADDRGTEAPRIERRCLGADEEDLAPRVHMLEAREPRVEIRARTFLHEGRSGPAAAAPGPSSATGSGVSGKNGSCTVRANPLEAGRDPSCELGVADQEDLDALAARELARMFTNATPRRTGGYETRLRRSRRPRKRYPGSRTRRIVPQERRRTVPPSRVVLLRVKLTAGSASCVSSPSLSSVSSSRLRMSRSPRIGRLSAASCSRAGADHPAPEGGLRQLGLGLDEPDLALLRVLYGSYRTPLQSLKLIEYFRRPSLASSNTSGAALPRLPAWSAHRRPGPP